MIIHDPDSGLITIHTRTTTYQMKAGPYGVLLHTYYGPRLRDGDLSYPLRGEDLGFSPNPPEAGADRSFSLDNVPQEYSGCGVGDYRLSSLEPELPNGSACLDLRFADCQILPGKYALEGLPAFFAGDEDVQTLLVRLRDDAAGLEVELLYGVFEQADLITRAVRVINRGTKLVRLRRCASLCLDFLDGTLEMITFDGRHMMERAPFRASLRPGIQSAGSIRGSSSHQHNPFVVLCRPGVDEDQGLCYGAMLLYSGNFEASAEVSQTGSARLVMGIHPFHFCWTLAPGESFTAPEAALVCTEDGLGAMSRLFHRAIRTHLLRDPWAGRRRPVLINNWEATYFHFDLARLTALAREAAALGIELFVLDDGWFGARDDDTRGLGDWTVNGSKLPGGLQALGEELSALGMGLGLWIEPEMVNEDSDLYRAHQDWVLAVPGRRPARSRSQLVLDFSRREVREAVYRQLKDVLSSAPVCYVKWDMNRSLSDVWSAALPADRQGEVYHRYVLGVYEMLEQMRRDFPHMLIEGCCGGGGRFDAGMLYYTPQIWCSDNTDAVDRLRIQYGTSFAYPPCTMGAHVSASPNEQNGRVTPLETRGMVAMGGTFGYELDLTRCGEGEKQAILEQVLWYKEHWELLWNGEYYRLTSPFQEGPFTAWSFVAPDRREALVMLVTRGSYLRPPFLTLRLAGLDPALTYQVDDGPVYIGDSLMAIGLPLPTLSGDYQSLCLYLKAV